MLETSHLSIQTSCKVGAHLLSLPVLSSQTHNGVGYLFTSAGSTRVTNRRPSLVLTPLICGVPKRYDKRYERSVKRNSTRCSVPPGLRWCPNVAGRVMPPDGSAAAVNEVGRKNVAQWEIGFSDLTNLTRLQVAHQPRAL